MKELLAAISPFVGGAYLGPDEALDKNALRAALQEVAHRNTLLFFIPVAMIVLLFVLVVAGFIWFANQPAKVGAILATSGVSIPWLIKRMLDLWQVKVQCDTILVLAGALDAATLRSILKAFMKGFAKA